MKYNIEILIKSILAGIMIGIGGTIYLSLDNKIVGSILFAIGLFIIVVYSFNLYTGKMGYLINNFNKKYIILSLFNSCSKLCYTSYFYFDR